MKKTLYLLLLIFSFVSLAMGHEPPSGTIKGRVTTSDHQPAAFVSILVLGTGRSFISDEEGFFTISKVPAGAQELEVTLIGYETLHQKVVVEENKTVKVPEYTLLSGTVFYDAPKFRISLKGNNLSNERYWNNNGTPQKPSNFVTSVSFKL